MPVKSNGTQLKHISFPPQQAVPELAKCNNHTKSYLLTSRGLWAITHFVRKAHQAGRLHSCRHCPTKRGCLDNELQTVQDMAKACKSSRKLAEASKVSVPQSDKVCPKRIKVWDKFFFGQCSYKLGRRANQAEEPHSYKQCPMKQNWLDMVSKQANSPNSKFWSTFLPFGVIRQQNLWTV